MTKPKPSASSSYGEMLKPSHDYPKRGYIEGFYGRLLSWDDRRRILHHLRDLGMSDYFYAPKDDPCHRFQWRQDYDSDWRHAFQNFTREAKTLDITVSAGLAPGIDFDFSGLDQGQDQGDYAILLNKAQAMLADGADAIGLLMDDIDPGFPSHAGGFAHEGAAHTALANRLAQDLDCPLHLTPRIYADNIYADNIEDGGQYLDHMARHLDPAIKVFTCGAHIVAADTDLADTKMIAHGFAAERLMIWDNLYAHDYCPRRLFLGAYMGRHDDQDILLNPTGMVETDVLLLSQMAKGPDQWRDTCREHGVPEAFFDVAAAFWLPPHHALDHTPQDYGLMPISPDRFEDMLKALDELLWRWKSPLQREWYGYLMGLRQDILLLSGQMSPWRINKTLPVLLAPHFQSDLNTKKD